MSKLWPKYENWSKQENHNRLYRYKSNLYRYKLVKNDQNRSCTGTSSNCTGTSLRKVPRMCVFSPIFPCFDIQSTLHFKHTSKPFQIHLGIYFLFNSSLNGYLSSKFFHESLPKIIPTWVTTHTQIKHDDYLGFNLTLAQLLVI